MCIKNRLKAATYNDTGFLEKLLKEVLLLNQLVATRHPNRAIETSLTCEYILCCYLRDPFQNPSQIV